VVTDTAKGIEGRVDPAAAAAADATEGESTPDAYDACPLNIEDEIADCRDAKLGGTTGGTTLLLLGAATGVGGGGTGGDTADTIAADVVFEDARIGARNIGTSCL